MILGNSHFSIAAALLVLALLTGCTAVAATPAAPTSTVVAVTAIAEDIVPDAAAGTPTPPRSSSSMLLAPTLIPTPTRTPTVTPFPTATPPSRTLDPVPGIWISAAELENLPMEGVAWERLEAHANDELEEPNMAGYTANSDVQALAIALVYARTGEESYREKAVEAITAVMGTEYTGLQKGPDSDQGALAVIVGRNLVSYVIAADLIDLANYDPELDEEFRDWIGELIYVEWADGSVVQEHQRRANNHGHMAGSSRAAVAVYLEDEAELLRTARVLKGVLGDREAYAGFSFRQDLSWQADPEQPVAINPPGSVKDGLNIDGAQPEEMRRGCSFTVPPCHTDYPWEGLQGIVVQAMILHRQGFDVWNWEDQAILRAVHFIERLQEEFPFDGWWAEGDDTWVPWVINDVYGTDFRTDPAQRGKNMGWTDWTHAPAVEVEDVENGEDLEDGEGEP